MTFGSLFAGIGGLDLGLERAGWTCRWQIECDPYCLAILAKHWPTVPRWSDIRLCDPGWCAPVDLVCGGFSCQDISAAGKGAGITGRRSGLWSEMLRLVSALRPRWVLVENVPALRTRGADVVLGGLAAEGYTCWPLVVGAWAVGSPHRRDRVWIVASLGSPNEPRLEGRDGQHHVAERHAGPAGSAAGLADTDRHGLWDESGRRSGTDGASTPVAGTDDGRYRWPARPGEAQYEWEQPRTTESPLGRAVDGTARRLALKVLGNSVVPQVVEMLGRAILAVAA